MPDERPQYFSNSDFDRVANDIISSPRRLKPDSFDSLFKINEKQQEYYTKCFRHLIKTTQGSIDMNGALCGADQRIVAFFKRSSLDVSSLSKIWALADVNEDGWLDLSEFSIAMHLVVLKVKGEVPIPEFLPTFARPIATPPRGGPPSGTRESQWSSPIPETRPIIKQFSDTPPLLVDSRPTAIKHSALLALKSPSGPPPAPPHRPQQKGHGRSASLDLKMIAFNNGSKLSEPSILVPPSSLALWSTTSDNEPPSSIVATATTSSPQPPSTTTTNFASFPGTPDSLPVPPPIPQRLSPSPLLKKCSTSNAATQTELKVYDEEEIRQFFTGFDEKLENLIGEEVEATEGKGVERWSKRCEALRNQNAELEIERARLAQVRIQLEIRIQEFEERVKNSSV